MNPDAALPMLLSDEKRPSRLRRVLPSMALAPVALGTTVLRGPFLPVVATVLVVWMVVCAAGVLAHLDPRRPRRPRAARARMPRVRREPPSKIPLLASHCVICGRPLTNQQSMLARVGSTCIKRHGPRPAWQDNPDHHRWIAERAAADAARAAEQARLDVQFDRAIAAYPAAEQAWRDELGSSDGLRRRERRRMALGRLGVGAMWSVVAVAATAVTTTL